MKKVLFILFVLALFSCKKANTSQGGKTDSAAVTTLKFNPKKFVSIYDTPFFEKKKVVTLEVSDESLVAGYPSLFQDETHFYIYTPNQPAPVLRFDKKGHFVNAIGAIGEGPAEYVLCSDVLYDEKEKLINILTDVKIKQYKPDGAYQQSIDHDLPASTFVKDEQDDCYWFYIGNNSMYSPYKLFKRNFRTGTVEKYLYEESQLFPMIENNFSKCGTTTFRETFNNKLYHIANGQLTERFTVDFGSLSLPAFIHQEDPMSVLDKLNNTHYATIRGFYENDNYVYLLISEKTKEDPIPFFYHWIIKKENNTSLLIKQVKHLSEESYLFFPQFLTDDDDLYFIGYILEQEEALGNPEENPSIVSINLKELL
ncbi:hypothetical protein M2137_002359 [Parabacteroides sp. PFB2-10]|uniref:6-bladed beta-propeller n=1 Tax=Parabacteroides sp. PFB2-10 TaxID=1742405 RepID=UPI0024745B2E|nr:6-bladed beta-propeller [Parabacteroides sp. PFB2-10]MDH6313569.1 hypothetical protein [Parabacteroides sp. PFB2-10]